MKIDAIITCIGENARNLLAVTLSFNQRHFDTTTIVTDTKDAETKDFCDYFKINCIQTDLFYKNNAKFNRGAVINYVIETLENPDWILQIDADIVLKNDFLYIKENFQYSKELFIGARRVIIPTHKDFLNLIHGKISEGKFKCYSGCGWGYFQLWNSNCKVIKSGAKYPESHDSSIGDWQWRNLWGKTANNDTEYEGNLIEINNTCLHLGEPNIEKAENYWK